MLDLRIATMAKLYREDEESSEPCCGPGIYRMSMLKANEGNSVYQCYKKQR